MREIVLDTETTGLDPKRGDRIVEIGAIELLNHIPSEVHFHRYMNPQRPMPAEAQAVHGLSDSFLQDKPVFADIAADFIEFISDSALIIHNAPFDLGFLNAELRSTGHKDIDENRVVDTLKLARQKHPTGPNSLDALCRRYGIDNSVRDKHGALIDSQLLAGVYLELIGGRQTTFRLDHDRANSKMHAQVRPTLTSTVRPRPLRSRLTDEEREAHSKLLDGLGKSAIWRKSIAAD